VVQRKGESRYHASTKDLRRDQHYARTNFNDTSETPHIGYDMYNTQTTSAGIFAIEGTMQQYYATFSK